MKDYINISRVYFIGIGGIGMSALARYFLSKNVIVSGYDKTPTPLTQQMESEGIAIHYEDNVELLDKNADLVVYTPAIPKDHKELNYYKNNNYEVVKRSDVLAADNYNRLLIFVLPVRMVKQPSVQWLRIFAAFRLWM